MSQDQNTFAAEPRDPERSIGLLIHEVSRLMQRNFNRRVQDLGLAQAQWKVLAYLSRREGVNQTTLADALEVQPITLARQIDRLEAAGWVERRADPNDRRAFRLHLTPAAAPMLSEIWQRADCTRQDALAGLSPEACAHLIDGLQAVKKALLVAESAAAQSMPKVEHVG